MGTVLITKFSEDKTKLDWAHEDGSGVDVLVGGLPHGFKMDGDGDKTILILECSVCHIKSFYPMSGGSTAQMLHRNHLLQDTLENVQADATARGIVIIDKTLEQLAIDIIKDECDKKGVSYLL